MSEKQPLLQVRNLKQYFKVNSGYTVRAVDDVSFDIYPGETYGLVGESGSGKSTIGRSIIRLYEPTDGQILFNGRDITGKLDKNATKTLRTQMQMIGLPESPEKGGGDHCRRAGHPPSVHQPGGAEGKGRPDSGQGGSCA